MQGQGRTKQVRTATGDRQGLRVGTGLCSQRRGTDQRQRVSRNGDQDRSHPRRCNEEQPLRKGTGPSPAPCPVPTPAWLDLPVSHRQPDVPSYHLRGSVWEICRERGHRLRKPVPWTF